MSVQPQKFLFVVGSSRPGGNTEALARRAAEHLPAGAEQRWLRLAELDVPRFSDIRHSGDGTYPGPDGVLGTLLSATLDATDLVIASPLYWYTVSTDVKNYLDHWTGWMRVPGADFKARMAGKRMWGVTALSDEDPAFAEPLAGALRLSAEYLHMDWRGVLLGYGSRPGDVERDADAQRNAKTFFAASA
ncbi:NAD(P)H-dependent oxidoreductase [Streptomyces sp. NPDC051940]|uniref:flavodoxin family protein n=1 Tax=Streptomyces sp. NPDC051940 TaxID=3155675 RepID=UPI00341FD5EC